MTLDWPHILVTMALIALTVFAINRLGWLDGASRGKRAVITASALFVVLFVLNLFWPYGAGLRP
jgi:hypothetical protein